MDLSESAPDRAEGGEVTLTYKGVTSFLQLVQDTVDLRVTQCHDSSLRSGHNTAGVGDLTRGIDPKPTPEPKPKPEPDSKPNLEFRQSTFPSECHE